MLLTTRDGTKLARYRDEGLDIFVGDTVVMRLEKNGSIYIKNQIVSIDVEAVYGVRELLKNLERDNVTIVDKAS